MPVRCCHALGDPRAHHRCHYHGHYQVKPVVVEKVSDGTFLYTFPKNFVGTIRVKALPHATAKSGLDLILGEWLADAAPAPAPPPPGPPAQCVRVAEHSVAKLGGCPKGETINAVDFASFGTPTGSCSTGFARGPCNLNTTAQYVESQCVGKADCSFVVGVDTFGKDPCGGTHKWLAAKISCGSATGSRSSAGSATGSGGGAAVPAAATATVSARAVVVGRVAADPLPPLPPRPGTGTVPVISGAKQQHETHVLRNGNHASDTVEWQQPNWWSFCDLCLAPPASPHVRTMWSISTCGEAAER